MIRRLVFVLFLVFAGIPVHAATGPATGSPAAAEQKSSELSAAELKQLVQTLNDPDARAKLVRQLDLMAAAQAAEKPSEGESLGSRVVKFLSDQVGVASEEFVALGRAFGGLPAAGRWVQQQIGDPAKRTRWMQLLGALALLMAAGAASFWLAELAVGRPRHAIEQHDVSGPVSRFILALLRLLLRLVPIGVSASITFSLLSLFNLPAVANIATVTILDAGLLIFLVALVSRFLFAPRISKLRLVPLSDRGALFIHRRVTWIGGIVILGWFGISAARLLGLPRIAAEAAFKLVGIAVLVMLIDLVLRSRRQVGAWIRGDAVEGAPIPGTAWGMVSLRRQLGDVWHLLVVAYLVVLFAIWVLELRGGFDFVARGTVLSIAIVVAAHLADHLFKGIAARSMALSQETGTRFPRLQERVDRYAPIVRATISVVVWLVALLAVIDIWGLDTLDWFRTPSGRQSVAKTVSILFVIVTATAAWEFVAAVIERYLVGAMVDGTPIQRSQRVRTLLPLLRNAFLIFLIVVVVLIVLSEIGLNIAPLLAGAGVVGLAIGFGAQTLVKDIITGIFILFENTIAVGDVVDVGSGHSGLVEHFSLRTIKLRDTAGGVHTVPFSNVTSVVNLTKEFAFYVFNIKVDYGQDTDRVIEVLKALGAELQADPDYGPLMLGPIEIFGVDSFGADAVIVQGRLKTRPIQQWAVGRQFNRRLKKRFEELKIPMSFPQSVIVNNAGGVERSDTSQSGGESSITDTATA
jgi:small conductance mechanosensitive channel